MKKFGNGLSVGALITAVLGLILLIFPTLTNKVLVYGIGIVLIGYGAYRIVRYLRHNAADVLIEHDLAYGLISAVTGIFMLTYSNVVISILPFLFGLYLIFGGVESIQAAVDVHRFGGARWAAHLILGLAFIIVGVVALRDPFDTAAALTRFIGAFMLAEGIYMCFAGIMVEKLRRAFRGEDNIVDEQ